MNLSGIVRQAEVVSVSVDTYTTLVLRNRDLAQAARPGSSSTFNAAKTSSAGPSPSAA